jgi:hypothetical protein
MHTNPGFTINERLNHRINTGFDVQIQGKKKVRSFDQGWPASQLWCSLYCVQKLTPLITLLMGPVLLWPHFWQ